MTPSPKRRRRAVGPAGAAPEQPVEPDRALLEEPPERPDARADEDLLRERPPHHERGV